MKSVYNILLERKEQRRKNKASFMLSLISVIITTVNSHKPSKERFQSSKRKISKSKLIQVGKTTSVKIIGVHVYVRES